MAFSRLFLVLAAIPFVLAHNGSDSGSDCGNNEFFYSKTSCCLPSGGVPNPPSPPSGTSCPSNGYYWHETKSCCVPHNANPPSPSCPSGTTWNDDKNACEHPASSSTPSKPSSTTPTKPSSTASTPSQSSSGNCGNNQFFWSGKGCCLEHGGEPNPPSPPKGTDCPSSGWSWSNDQGCCVPHSPSPPTPSCGNGWLWQSGLFHCTPSQSTTPATPTSTPSKPSPTTSTPIKPTQPSSSGNCGDNEFYFGGKDCCIPHGGFPTPPSPPSGTSCPPSNWSWNQDKGCCLPHSPPTQLPPPQCPTGWSWDASSYKCSPNTPSSTPSVPQPSGHYNHHKRGVKARAVSLCPNKLSACPIAGLSGLTGDYECLDVQTELTSCGGCASTGAGQDCSTIPGAWNVACEAGACKVYTCAQGYKKSNDGKTCVQL
ncbi:hypothetical protein C8Q75DRAFT_731202 [Abortiporus biennis]|nr:hypothetical protein C8Q75DRAFT_731202 [Abortiporus biennis]